MPFPKLDPTGKFQFAGPINETKGPPYRVMIAGFLETTQSIQRHLGM